MSQEQKMADLPADRLSEARTVRWTTGHVRLNCYQGRQKRAYRKRYGCLFTGLACRAVHIEIANSLGTTSFINVLRRFVERRGNIIRQLRSDNGSNFIGS